MGSHPGSQFPLGHVDLKASQVPEALMLSSFVSIDGLERAPIFADDQREQVVSVQPSRGFDPGWSQAVVLALPEKEKLLKFGEMFVHAVGCCTAREA